MRVTLSTGTIAEHATPASGSAVGGLVLLPDIMGLRPLFDEHCQRLADATNRVVCAPEPFPIIPGRELTLEDRLATMELLHDEVVLADVVAAADACGVDPVGVLGFCMGGMYALKAAGTGRFDRAVSFYGMIRVPLQWRSDGQGEPLDAISAPGACPILAIIGTHDVWTPKVDVDALEATGATVVRYQGAEHGFVHDPERPAHRPEDAADAWLRAIAFLTASPSPA